MNANNEKRQEATANLNMGSSSSDLEKAASTEKPINSQDDLVDGRTIISFDENEKSNPYNWSRSKKLYCATVSMLLVLNSAMGSSLPSGAVEQMKMQFDVHEQVYLVLPVSIYLFGYMLGPLGFSPLSESYGRKVVMVSTFAIFTAFVLGCALAKNYTSFIIFRLLAGIGASTPMSVIGGIFADLYSTPRARGTAIACFMSCATWGPVAGPILSGFVGPEYSWTWVFWVELIIAGITWPFFIVMPETYGPVLLRRKAKRMREESGNPTIFAPADLEKRNLWELLTVVLTRPIRMFLFEAIVLFSCLYLALAYGVFYGFFQAFDPIFSGTYGFTRGQVGLCFLPLGIGSMIAAVLYLWWDSFLDNVQRRVNPPVWSQTEEYIRLPLACFGGPLIAISLFWLGWTSRSDIHWIVPVLSGLPFGCGFLLIFLALTNYVVDAYEIFAASALGAISSSRSIFGGALPFAAKPMYSRLGISWACTLWGVLSTLMCLVPFAFLKYGPQIRRNSKFCLELKGKKGSR